MDGTSMIRVLLVGGSPQSFLIHQKRLERNGCECEFAECERTAWEMLSDRQFDLVLSLHSSRGTSSPSLGLLLGGSATTLFYAVRVEVGYWWVPILRLGEECFGSSVLRPCEFANALDEVLKEIRTMATWSGNPMRMEQPTTVHAKKVAIAESDWGVRGSRE